MDDRARRDDAENAGDILPRPRPLRIRPLAERPTTLGKLKSSGYRVLPVKAELRKNLIAKLRAREALFPGIIGYDDTVLPQLQNALLSGQDLILLGERGQGKSRILRSLVSLLD